MGTVLKFRLNCLLLDEISSSLYESIRSINVESNWFPDDVKREIRKQSAFYQQQDISMCHIKLYVLKEYLDAPILSKLHPNPQEATLYGDKAVSKFTGLSKVRHYFQESLNYEDAQKIHLIVIVHS